MRWHRQHLSSCLLPVLPRMLTGAVPLAAAQPWLPSLSYLYSRAAARLKNVLIKIKFKKKKQAGRGRGRHAEGQADRPVLRDDRGRAGAVWERSKLKPPRGSAEG